jgi:alpha/beta superfamily hydrolase
MNLVSGYAAANPWLPALLWRAPDASGTFAAALPAVPVSTAGVVGYYVAPAEARATVVVVHGYNSTPDDGPVVTVAQWLHASGYGVLALELGYLRGAHRYTAGHREAADIAVAIDWLTAQGDTLAGVWGFSAGAHASLIAATRDPRIPSVISDSAFASGADQIQRVASATWRIPEILFPLAGPAVRIFSGYAPRDVLAHPWADTPVLLVHGDQDDTVPLHDAQRLAEHTGGTLLVLPGVEHTQAHRDAAATYRHHALAFLHAGHTGANPPG